MKSYVSSIRAGDLVRVEGLSCMRDGPAIVHEDVDGLYLNCKHGKHHLIGDMSGIYLPSVTAETEAMWKLTENGVIFISHADWDVGKLFLTEAEANAFILRSTAGERPEGLTDKEWLDECLCGDWRWDDAEFELTKKGT